MTNHLAGESSPYLLQHVENPVDWYPWGPEALEKAKLEDKPIFLSIGYSACHWCHVMAHESFEDSQVAILMNQYFVNIKVDREERPDLDSIYMNAVVAMTGNGGWPMSVFLTPDGMPFFGGTYFPPVRRYNMPAFREVLLTVARLWNEDRAELITSGKKLADYLELTSTTPTAEGQLDSSLLVDAELKLLETYDWQHGGWGRAPKFPQPMAIEFLLRRSLGGNHKPLKAVTHALDAMARGGMYDILGGGFSRYSTDDRWLVPHFEKMLYDNAQLALVYLYAYKMTGLDSYRNICESTLDFLVREMSVVPKHTDDHQIGFFSSLDADSEGEEGKYYLWEFEEIQLVIPNPTAFSLFAEAYGVSAIGKFEGKNILQRAKSNAELAGLFNISEADVAASLDNSRRLLFLKRQERIRPGSDDKVLTCWNALALIAFAEAGRYLNRTDYVNVARANAVFLLDQLWVDGILYRAWRNGQVRHKAYLEDYAALTLALLTLYKAMPGNHRWYQQARLLAQTMIEHFVDPAGGFFDTRDDHEPLLIRPKDTQDNATPAGNSLAALALLELAAYSGENHGIEGVVLLMRSLLSMVVKYPLGFSKWLCAFDARIEGFTELAILGDITDPSTISFLGVPASTYYPRLVLAAAALPLAQDAPELLRDRHLLHGQATAYVCKQFVCRQPVISPLELANQLFSQTNTTIQGA